MCRRPGIPAAAEETPATQEDDMDVTWSVSPRLASGWIRRARRSHLSNCACAAVVARGGILWVGGGCPDESGAGNRAQSRSHGGGWRGLRHCHQ
eukprot:6480171-Amphidinium_carterae.1